MISSKKTDVINYRIPFYIILIIDIVFLMVLWTKAHDNGNFEEINTQRINIIEADGTLKLALFSSGKIEMGKDGNKRSGAGTISGMFFYNEEGYESGGLVFDGKKITNGQDAGIGLMFDGYRQDQTIALQHNEFKDSLTSLYEDGLRIMSRPDRADVKEEYDFYKLRYPEVFGDEDTPRVLKEPLDSMELVLAGKNKIAKQRIYLGSKRGDLGKGWFDESGLYIKNKYGKTMIKIYVDDQNRAKIQILDTMGRKVVHELSRMTGSDTFTEKR